MNNYFSVNDAEDYVFYRIPKLLFSVKAYSKLSTDAKMLYGLLLDRMSLSIKNQWTDDLGHVFIYFTIKEIKETFKCCCSKAEGLLDELEKHELIERKRNGLGKPNSIFLKKIIKNIDEDLQNFENTKCRGFKNENLEFQKTEIKNSEKQKLGVLKNRNQEFHKTESINTDITNTELYSINPSIEYNWIEGLIKHNIDYEYLVLENDKELVDEILKIIVNVMTSTQKTTIL